MFFNAWGAQIMWFGMIYHFDRINPVPIIGDLPGYPSGHTMSMFTIYAALLYIFLNRIQKRGRGWLFFIIWFIWAALNELSRLYLRVHYPTDVFAGYAFGLAWLGLSMLLLRAPDKKRMSNVEN